ncbi:MAG: hypothetical protein ACFB0G_07700 [Leptolyngbyaceae cyanobacterium]
MDVLIQQQRLQHIVDSYALAGRDATLFDRRLAALIQQYSYNAVELALVEGLVQNWLRYPLPRGMAFLEQIQTRLQAWREAAMISTGLTPTQFEQVTGLPPYSFENMATSPIDLAAAELRSPPAPAHRSEELPHPFSSDFNA